MKFQKKDAQMLERCAVLHRDTFSEGQMDICHRFSIQIEYQCVSKESAKGCAQGIH